MTRLFPLAPMSGLFLGLTVVLWALPLVFLAGGTSVLAPVLVPTGCFLVVVYGSVWLWWRPSRFELSPEGLQVVFPLRSKKTPAQKMASVERIDSDELKRRYGRLVRVGAGGLWGGFGWLWGPGRWVEFYISRMDGWVLITRPDGAPLLITPDRPDEFVSWCSSLVSPS
jgi:hypothetical protein